MPSKNPLLRFQDIIEEIDFVTSTTDGMAFADFVADPVVRRAVERSYAIISEAAVKLGDDAAQYAPAVPWADIRGIGNFIRHEYGAVDYQTLWDIRGGDLDDLRAACVSAAERLAEPENGNHTGTPRPPTAPTK